MSEGHSIELEWAVLVRDNERHTLLRNRGKKASFRIGSTARYRESLEAAANIVSARWRGPLFTGRVAVEIQFFEPDRRYKRDIANYLKLICDALKGVCFVDDAQIDDIRIVRHPPSEFPRAVIRVDELVETASILQRS